MKSNHLTTEIPVQATGCSLDQVRAIFGKVKIITLAEIQAVIDRGVWPEDANAN